MRRLKAGPGAPGLVIIDVLEGKDWSGSNRKIAGAVREDLKKFEIWRDKHPTTKTVVPHGARKDGGTGVGLALKLIKSGYTMVEALKRGWEEWHKAGYPVETRTLPGSERP